MPQTWRRIFLGPVVGEQVSTALLLDGAIGAQPFVQKHLLFPRLNNYEVKVGATLRHCRSWGRRAEKGAILSDRPDFRG